MEGDRDAESDEEAQQPPQPAPTGVAAEAIRLAREAAAKGNVFPDARPIASTRAARASGGTGAALELGVVPCDGAGVEGATTTGASPSKPKPAAARPEPEYVAVPMPNRSRTATIVTLSPSYFAEKALEAETSGVSVCLTITCLVLWLGSGALYAWQIILYADHKNEHCERDLTLWLLVSGCIGGVGLIVSLLKTCCLLDRVRRWSCVRCCLDNWFQILESCSGCVSCAGLAWLIVGSVWVYGIGNYDNVASSRCPDPVFLFVWYLITATWAFAGFMCIFGCVVLCCASFFQWRV